MSNKILTILSGSPRGGEKTWESLYKNVLDYLGSDLALCTTENYVLSNSLFERANYTWILENYDNFELYYKKYYSGSWKEYFELGKGYGLYESGLIHFALKDFIKSNYMEIINKYDFIIFSRFDQFYIDKHPYLQNNKILIPKGEDYFGLCDRHAAFDSKLAYKYFSIVDYINNTESLNNIPSFPNCESVYLKQLESNKLIDNVERVDRFLFTSALKSDKTNWRIPKYKIFFIKNLMIKYPDEFIDGVKNAIKNYGLLKFIKDNFFIVLTYFYLRIRQIFRIRSRIESNKND